MKKYEVKLFCTVEELESFLNNKQVELEDIKITMSNRSILVVVRRR